jgi:hypothetical protein
MFDSNLVQNDFFYQHGWSILVSTPLSCYMCHFTFRQVQQIFSKPRHRVCPDDEPRHPNEHTDIVGQYCAMSVLSCLSLNSGMALDAPSHAVPSQSTRRLNGLMPCRPLMREAGGHARVIATPLLLPLLCHRCALSHVATTATPRHCHIKTRAARLCVRMHGTCYEPRHLNEHADIVGQYRAVSCHRS